MDLCVQAGVVAYCAKAHGCSVGDTCEQAKNTYKVNLKQGECNSDCSSAAGVKPWAAATSLVSLVLAGVVYMA